MSGKIFLSPLKSKGSLPTPPPGRWHSQGDFLSKYSSDIPVEGRFDDRHLVHCVPTVFARPIQFYQALENPEHPAHASVRGQWRGLLAIVALQKWLGAAVEYRKFSLPEALHGRSLSGDARAGADLPLLSILSGQLPKPESEWERWWLLYCEGELVGATSPWSLVYTPAEYRCPKSVLWQRDGRLIDPQEHFEATAPELALLGAWLDQVLKGERDRWGVASRSHLDTAMRTIVQLLHAWQMDLKPHQDQRFSRRPLVAGATSVREDPYRHFLNPIDTVGVSMPSDLLLAADSGESVLVFSQAGVDSRKRVHGPVLASQVDVAALPGATGEAGWKTPAGQAIPFPYLVAEAVFFPPKLAQMPLSEDALATGVKGFALPLTPVFFRFFSLESLLQKNMLEVGGDDGRVVARLRLPLAGGEHLTVEHVYRLADDVINPDSPALAFWPDFVDPAWRHNLALMSAPRESDLAVAPLVAGGETLRPSSTDGKEKTFRLWASARPILGFALQQRDANGRSVDVGVVIRRAARKVETRTAAAWKVAVDFGTSSTNLLVEEAGASGPRPLVLARRTVLLTRASSGFESEVARSVYPHREVPPPFPTMLFRNDGSLVESDGMLPGRQDLYTPRFVYFPEDFYYDTSNPVKNLKWAGRGESVTPIREYLTSLVRAIAGEALAAGAAEIEFEWSFPLSLPSGTKSSMATFWQTTARSFSIPEVLEIRAHPGISESEAICRHAVSLLPVRSESLSIAVDIGGGSSDIGFWTASKLLGQVSLKLAGNDVLVPLVDLGGFLDQLVSICDPTSSPDHHNLDLDLVRRHSAVHVNAWLAQAVSANGQRFTGDPRNHPLPVALATMVDAGQPPWSIARSLIYLFASGLTFYIGLHARKWMEGIGIKTATLRLGGRGAALLTWLTLDRELEELLRSVFLGGLALDKEDNAAVDVKVFAPGTWYEPRSPLKGEVVQGLLAPALGGEAPDRPTTTIVGEIGWRDKQGEPLAWDSEIGAAQVESLKPPPNNDSGYMAHFLRRIVPRYADKLNLDGPGLSSLRLDSAKVQNQLRQGVSEDQEVLQPVFAVELKVLMEEYLRQARVTHG